MLAEIDRRQPAVSDGLDVHAPQKRAGPTAHASRRVVQPAGDQAERMTVDCPNVGTHARTSIGENTDPPIIDALRNPGGYCGLGGTGVACPVGVAG